MMLMNIIFSGKIHHWFTPKFHIIGYCC